MIFQYDRKAGTVMAMMMTDFLLRASWPSKSLYWESNLLNISPAYTLSPINLFLGEVGVCKNLKDAEEISKMLFPFSTSFFAKKETFRLQDLRHSSTEAAGRALPEPLTPQCTFQPPRTAAGTDPCPGCRGRFPSGLQCVKTRSGGP